MPHGSSCNCPTGDGLTAPARLDRPAPPTRSRPTSARSLLLAQALPPLTQMCPPTQGHTRSGQEADRGVDARRRSGHSYRPPERERLGLRLSQLVLKAIRPPVPTPEEDCVMATDPKIRRRSPPSAGRRLRPPVDRAAGSQ